MQLICQSLKIKYFYKHLYITIYTLHVCFLQVLIGEKRIISWLTFLVLFKGVFMCTSSNGLEGHGNTFLNQEESFYNYLGIRTLSSKVLLFLPPYF